MLDQGEEGQAVTVYTKAGTLTRKLVAGARTVAFSGRIGRKA